MMERPPEEISRRALFLEGCFDWQGGRRWRAPSQDIEGVRKVELRARARIGGFLRFSSSRFAASVVS